MLKSTFKLFRILYHKSPYDAWVFVYFLSIPLIDTLNGIFLKSNLPSIAQPYKTLFIFILLLKIFSFSRFFGLISILFMLPFFLSDIVNTIHLQDSFYFGKDFGNSLKQMMFVVGFIYFFFFLKKLKPTLRLAYITSIFQFGFFIVAINLLIGALGFGYPQYVIWTSSGQKITIGTTGFYFDGNSIAALLILYGSFICFKFWNKSRIWFFPFILFLLILAYFKATKVALLGPFILAIGIPFFNERIEIFKFTKLKLNYSLFFLLFSLLVGPLIFNQVMNSKIGNRLSSMYNQVDFLTFLLSDRNRFLQAGWQSFSQDFSVREILLGRGYYSTEAPAKKSIYYGKNKTIELDFFDILFEKGLIGLLLSYGLFLYVILYSIYNNFFTLGNWLSPLTALLNTLFFALSFLSGHIVGSGILGIYLGLLNSYIFLNPKGFHFANYSKS